MILQPKGGHPERVQVRKVSNYRTRIATGPRVSDQAVSPQAVHIVLSPNRGLGARISIGPAGPAIYRKQQMIHHLDLSQDRGNRIIVGGKWVILAVDTR